MAKSNSTAYDMSLFESNAPRLRAVKSSEKSAATKQKQQRHQRAKHLILDILLVGALVAVLITMIVSHAEMTELTDYRTKQIEQGVNSKSYADTLDTEKAKIQSAENVDAYAKENGMEKVESYQIEYITVDGGDKIEVSDPAPTGMIETIGAAIAGWFGA